MKFGIALTMLQSGLCKGIRLPQWKDDVVVKLQTPDENSKMTHPYIFIDTTGLETDNPDAPRDRVPWLASQTDMLSEDWEEI